MPLVKCPDCSADVSTPAPACPRCGCPADAWHLVTAAATAVHGDVPADDRTAPRPRSAAVYLSVPEPLPYAAAVLVATPAPSPRVIRNASSNCVAMFVLFLLYLLAVPLRVVRMLPTIVDAMLGLVLLPVGIYCLFYLPLRWSVIRTLPVDRRVPGAVGGLGLILLTIIVIACVVRYASG